MPQIYQLDPRAKKYKKPNQTDIENAIRAVRSKQVTYREAQEIYVIHYSVIYHHGKNSNMKKQGGQTFLTVSEVNMLIECILLCAEWVFPLDQYDLRLKISK